MENKGYSYITLVEETPLERALSKVAENVRGKAAIPVIAAAAVTATMIALPLPSQSAQAAFDDVSEPMSIEAVQLPVMETQYVQSQPETVKTQTITAMNGYTFTAAAQQNPISAKTSDNLVAAVAAEDSGAGTRKSAYVEAADVAEIAEQASEEAIRIAATGETGNLGEATGELKKALDAAAAEQGDQAKKAEARAEEEARAAREAYLASEEGKREMLVEAAKSRLGVPYVWGGTDPDYGMDCSGFTQWCYSQIGISIPRTTYSQAGGADAVISVSEAKPGDILYSGGHVGLYIGDGVFIHEPQSGDVCRESTDMGQFYSALRYL